MSMLAFPRGSSRRGSRCHPRFEPLEARGLLSTTIHQFPIPTPGGDQPTSIAKGSDGNLWFTERVVYPIGIDWITPPPESGAIGRITPAGKVTLYPLPHAAPGGIVAGPDGNLWFEETRVVDGIVVTDRIGRITTKGVITEFEARGDVGSNLAVGPGKNLYYISGSNIDRITRGGVVSSTSVGPELGTSLTATADGSLWFSTYRQGRVTIGRMTPDGRVAEFPLNSPSVGIESLAAGPDGNVWFTENSYGASPKVGRVTPKGVVTEFSTSRTFENYGQIIAGPGGDLYAIEQAVDNPQAHTVASTSLVRIATNGSSTTTPLPSFNGIGSGGAIAWGPGNTLWFGEYGTGKIGEISFPASVIPPKPPHLIK